MDRTLSDVLFDGLQHRLAESYENRSINRKTAFRQSMEKNGAEYHESEFGFTDADRTWAKEAVEAAEATYSPEKAKEREAEEALLVAWSEIISGDNGLEIAQLLNYDDIDKATIEHMKKLAQPENINRTQTIIDCWTKESADSESGDRVIHGELIGQLLHGVDQVLKGHFIEDMKSLIDLPFTQEGKLEIFLTGGSGIERFQQFLLDNRSELKPTQFNDAAACGKDKMFRRTMETLCGLMNWNFTFIERVSGTKKNPGATKNEYIKVIRRKALVNYYKRIKLPKVPKKSSEQERWLLEYLLNENLIRTLRIIEQDYLDCLVDRAIIERRPYILNSVYDGIQTARSLRGV